jgi:hypothetical protein
MDREANVGGILGETFALLGDASRAVMLYVVAIGALNALGFAFGLPRPGKSADLLPGRLPAEPGEPGGGIPFRPRRRGRKRGGRLLADYPIPRGAWPLR